MSEENLGIAFGLVIGAGLATTLGAAIVFSKRLVQLVNRSFFACSLSFSAGVMIYVSLLEIFPKALESFEEAGLEGNSTSGHVYVASTGCFFGGILLCAFLNIIVHKMGHFHSQDLFAEVETKPKEHTDNAKVQDVTVEAVSIKIDMEGKKTESPSSEASEEQKKLMNMSMMTAIAINLHNFPEGLATFAGALVDPTVGVALAIAIGIHNIPEGLSVAIPVYYATGSRKKAFFWAFLSGVSEPIGALVGWFLLKSIMGDMVFGVLFGIVSGMMTYICIQELLPTAFRYDPENKIASISFFTGTFVMAFSLVLFAL